MERYLIETEKVDARMVHYERIVSFGDKSGLLDEYGFLRDPRWGLGLKKLDDLVKGSGAVIVAESGLGKTFVAREFAREKGPDSVLFIDVQQFRGDASSLVSEIRGASDKQYVCLDGLDEAQDLAGAVARGLNSLDPAVKRLIFSRGIPELRQFTDVGKLPMYSLLPLSSEDVKALAQERDVEGDAFVSEVIAKSLGPVCAKPLGCLALLEQFKADAGLQGNGDELQQQMILRLCAENDRNPNRYTSSAPVTADVCFSYAKKIALVLKLSGLSVFKRMDEMGSVPSAVDFSAYGDLFDKAVFNAILLRGLFLPIGADRFRFAHITYFDYLAAQGLMECVARKNWREIMMNGDGFVYPQWANAVAWVAAKDGEIFDAVFDHQPELLLSSDGAASKKSPAELCRAVLLRAASMDYWSRQSSGIVSRFAKLVSPDTFGVLRDLLWSEEESCRDMTIDVVKRCGVRELVPELVKVFCDASVPCDLRKHAGYALLWLEPVAADVLDCKSVLNQSKCPQTLKSIVFKLLWPYAMSAAEMIAHLTVKEDAIGDAYSSWVSDGCPQRLPEMSYEDALEMLKWAAYDVGKDDNSIHTLRNLKRKVFTYCFKRYDSPEMCDALAAVYESFGDVHKSPLYLKRDHEESACWMCSDDEFNGLVIERRRLAETVVRRGRKDAVLRVTGWVCALLDPADIDFVDGKIDAEKDNDICLRWVQCLAHLAGFIPLPDWAKRWNDLHKRFPAVFKCTAKRALAGREKSSRDHARRQLKNQAKLLTHERDKEANYSISLKRIRESIATHSLGRNFYGFTDYCSGQPRDGKRSGWGFHICWSRVWDDLSEEEQNGVVQSAEDFLLNAKAPDRESGNSIYLAPFASFILLQEVSPQRLNVLPQRVWHEFRFEIMQGGYLDEAESAMSVLSCYCRMYRDDFVESIVEYLTYPRTDGVRLSLGELKRLVKADEDLCMTLLRRLDNDNLGDSDRRNLLDEFWGVSEAVMLRYLRTDNRYRQLDLLQRPALSVFSLYAHPELFDELMEQLEERSAIAREWVVSVVGQESCWHSSLSYLVRMLQTKDVARFYLAIRKHFPIKDAPVHLGAYSPTAIDEIYTFSSYLITVICERKDIELVSTLEMLVRELPDERYLRDHLIRARKDVLALSCPVYKVSTIKELLDEQNKAYLVNTPASLCHIVLESLGRYRELLSGKKSYRARLLWNVQKNPMKVWHKDEEDFSDDMRDFLERDLKNLVINREVQLNRGRQGEPGSRTDIWVEALDVVHTNKLALCIEVKGSWNRSSKNALESQLIRKYMGDGGADAGILVLGWFDAPPSYVSRNVWKSIEQARVELMEQVAVARSRGFEVSSVVLDCQL